MGSPHTCPGGARGDRRDRRVFFSENSVCSVARIDLAHSFSHSVLTKEEYSIFFSVIIPGLAEDKDAIQLGRLPDLLPRCHNRILSTAAPLPLAAPARGQLLLLHGLYPEVHSHPGGHDHRGLLCGAGPGEI